MWAYLDSLQLTFRSLAVLVECLGSPDEVALSSGWHCFREILDSCDEGATCRLEVVDARDARQLQFIAATHPLAEHDLGTVPVNVFAASEPVRSSLEEVAVHVEAEIAVFARDLCDRLIRSAAVNLEVSA